MGRRSGWRLLGSFVLLLGLVGVLSVVLVRSENVVLSGIPFVVAATGGTLIGYRQRHEYWPWDTKRRKIERWRWLVEGPEASKPVPGFGIGATIFALLAVLVTMSALTAVLFQGTFW